MKYALSSQMENLTDEEKQMIYIICLESPTMQDAVKSIRKLLGFGMFDIKKYIQKNNMINLIESKTSL